MVRGVISKERKRAVKKSSPYASMMPVVVEESGCKALKIRAVSVFLDRRDYKRLVE
jgi:hypothetical protein